MKMVVGLGNPGRKYAGTRHNVGFMVLDQLEKRFAVESSRRTRFESEQNEIRAGGERVILVWPQTFMNLSGSATQPTRDFFKLTNPDMLVVCDDLNLPLGRLRFRAKGSSGGQKGLADILQRLGTDEITRLRLGIGVADNPRDAASFVLSKFSAEELSTVEQMVGRAADAALAWIEHGTEHCMNSYNAAS